MTSVSTGKRAEALAEKYLKSRGLVLECRNFRAKTGEIDLIMSQGDLLIFIEVRYRINPNFGSGADSVSYQKRRKIARTAELYLQKSGLRWKRYRFDVVSIGDELAWIENAFTLDQEL